MAFRVYVTDAVKLAAENIARISGGGSMSSRFVDLVYPGQEETRTEEELIAQVRKGWM